MRACRGRFVFVILAVVGSGCGARLDSRQMAAATNRGSDGGAAVGSPSAPVSSAPVSRIAADAGRAGPATGGPVTIGGATSSRRPAAGPGAAGDTARAPGLVAPAAPAAGNGGSTDVGVSADSILLGNVSTLTGPVPGLFKGAVVGTQAFLAYQNSLGGVYGRRLNLKVGDDALDDGEHRNQVVNLIPQVFAFVGSFSVFDDAGTEEMSRTNVPDVGVGLSPQRFALKNNFSIAPIAPGAERGPLNYFKARFGPSVTSRVGSIYADVPSSVAAYRGLKTAMLSVGYQFVYERKYEATESDFTADIVRMRQAGVKEIVMQADVATIARVAKASAQQGFSVPLANYGATAYDRAFLTQAGPAAEGAEWNQNIALYQGEDAATVPEVQLMDTWIQRVSPGSSADLFTLYGWASARLFVQALVAAGPRATRDSTLNALRHIDDFDGNGILAPAGPASKRPPTCFLVIKVHAGHFTRVDPPGRGFRCNDGGYFYLH
ncbi:MAG: ABC transporter substrate-binding protein [Acidimicrobiales bacterium]